MRHDDSDFTKFLDILLQHGSDYYSKFFTQEYLLGLGKWVDQDNQRNWYELMSVDHSLYTYSYAHKNGMIQDFVNYLKSIQKIAFEESIQSTKPTLDEQVESLLSVPFSDATKISDVESYLLWLLEKATKEILQGGGMYENYSPYLALRYKAGIYLLETQVSSETYIQALSLINSHMSIYIHDIQKQDLNKNWVEENRNNYDEFIKTITYWETEDFFKQAKELLLQSYSREKEKIMNELEWSDTYNDYTKLDS